MWMPKNGNLTCMDQSCFTQSFKPIIWKAITAGVRGWDTLAHVFFLLIIRDDTLVLERYIIKHGCNLILYKCMWEQQVTIICCHFSSSFMLFPFLCFTGVATSHSTDDSTPVLFPVGPWFGLQRIHRARKRLRRSGHCAYDPAINGITWDIHRYNIIMG